MRNLKKVLALALATVMLLGMMAMASAADYNDEALIADQYDAAVDVMSAIGVFNGSKGNFNPKGTLTRAEAAKVITYVALTKANADKLGTAEAPFADVPADNWAAGSIAYAKNLGIVSGSAGNYRPNDTITGYEFAKMLLVVCGYNADAEGFKGDGWSTNIDSVALETGLKAGLAIDMGAAILREEACQMAFNALEVTCVGYTGGTTLETGDTKIVVGGNRYVVANDTTNYKVGAAQDGKQQLAEKLYPTLKVNEATENAFGYATKTWTLAGKTVGTEAKANVLLSYAGNAKDVTVGALYNALGKVDDVEIYVNGADAQADFNIARDPGTGKPFANYAGALVEVVDENGDGIADEVLVSAAVPAKVTKVIAATAAVDRKVEMTVYTNATGATMQYTTNKYEAGDYVLVYLKNNAIIKVEAAETVYGTLTQTGESAGATVSLYMDGTAIPVANASMATKAGDTTVAAADYTTAMNKKATVVLENGYAVAFIGDAAKADISKYVYLAKAVNASTGAISDEYGTVYYPAQVVYMDGTTGIVKLASNADVAVGFYKLGTSGSYKTLDAVATTPDYEVAANFYAKDTTTAEFEMKATSKSLALTGNTKAYITPNTKILFVSGTNANLKVEVATGAMATTLAANTKVLVSEVSKAADAAKEVDVIVVPAAMTTNVDDLYYVVAKDLGDVYVAADTADHIKDQVAVYNVKTGEKKVVMVDDIATVVTGFSTYTVDANGVYDFTLKTGAAYAAFDKNADIKLYGNLLSVDSAIVDADAAEAVIIDITGKGLVKTLTALNEKDATVEFATVRNTTTNKITAIVVTAY